MPIAFNKKDPNQIAEELAIMIKTFNRELRLSRGPLKSTIKYEVADAITLEFGKTLFRNFERIQESQVRFLDKNS